MKGWLQYVRRLALPLGLALALPAPAAELGAHQHGVARLDVVVDGPTLLISLDSPLANLLGFEHAPRNERDRSALGKMEADLRAAGGFQPNSEAGCQLVEVKVEHPFQAAANTSAAPTKGQPPGGKPAAGHTDAEVSWIFRCATPAALHQLDVALFERFAGLASLQVQLAGPRGQSASVLNRRQRRLVW